MYFSFNYSLLHSLNQFILWVSLFFYLNFSINSNNWFDLFSRVNHNDFYLNYYYYLWTTFWYIPFFITILIIFHYINSFLYIHNHLLLLILLILMLVFSDLHFYWQLNIQIYSYFNKSDFFNNLLLNSINKYHPGLLYWTSLYLITYWLFIVNWFNNLCITFSNRLLNKYFTKYIIINTLLLIITLGLGGWWALQEGSWGGWWNWDPSEVFGLLIWFFYIIYFHKLWSKQNIYTNTVWDILFLIILFQIYFFTQLNFDLVSHNFGTKIDNFIDNTNLYTLFIIISIFWVIRFGQIQWNIYKNLIIKCNIIQQNYFNRFVLYTYFIILLLLYEIIYSLIPLINDFLWKLLSINLTNSILIFSKFSLDIIVLIWIFFWQFNLNFISILICNYVFFNIPIIIFLINRLNLLNFTHLNFSYFIWISLLSYYYTYVDWILLDSVFFLYCKHSILSIQSLTLEAMQYIFTNHEFTYTWNLFWHDTTFEVYSFIFNLTNYNTNQTMILGNFINQFVININDILSVSIIWSLILLIYMYYKFFIYIYKIVF